MPARFEVHRAELPTFGRIVDALLKAALLFFIVHRKPELDEVDARPDQHFLELRTRPQELSVFDLGAEPHHALDAGAVVPAPVEQHDLPSARQFSDVALEIPLTTLAFSRCTECHHAADAWIEALGDALNGPTLTGRVPAFEYDYDLEALETDPFLQLD